ncbi:SAVED domain-containing protein [Clostridium formicaceticum]|uniref:SMODS-associated and fused to various effectors domain-containing protein n=1 Tax=Clostridium formicaceticum TaxID=1497 RepID=A0AAC9RRD0_9CLOT|nr:SAVED domain-containing protein [Clostridium formicaceticum]AOY75006.1 hypothetical protein BJL90_02940 [Clostridium formicaceticum]ARE89423.1 hypothetical protein CLFO_38300 [Clostridium formicaceticum]
MTITVYKTIVAVLFIGLTIFNIYKGGIRLKEGYFEQIAPFAILETGISLITAGVFSIDSSLIAMYAMSGENQQLSILDYITMAQTEFTLIGLGILMCIISCFVHKALSTDRSIRLLNIQAYDDNRLEYLSTKKCKGKIVEGIYIDLIGLWEELRARKTSSAEFKRIIDKMVGVVDKQVTLFKAGTSKYKRAFTGIAPIPLLIYTGRLIPKLGFSEYLEIQKLENENDLIPLDTTGKIQYSQLQVENNLTTSNEDDEVVVAVSTTQQIDNNDLLQFINKGIEVKHIFLENPNHKSIVSVKQINEYAEVISREILNIKKIKPKLKTIHLVCSSKPSLMFRLGQLIDDTQMPVIISYQYTQQDDNRYPWGIYINHYKKQGELHRWI